MYVCRVFFLVTLEISALQPVNDSAVNYLPSLYSKKKMYIQVEEWQHFTAFSDFDYFSLCSLDSIEHRTDEQNFK